MNFETFFNISVWFDCFPPEASYTCHLFLIRSLAGLEIATVDGRLLRQQIDAMNFVDPALAWADGIYVSECIEQPTVDGEPCKLRPV